MQQLTRNLFVETRIRGCNHGFVTTSDGIVMIDSPHKPSDALKLRRETPAVHKSESASSTVTVVSCFS